MGDTDAEIRSYLRAVSCAVVAELIDRSIGDSLVKAASECLKSIARERDRTVMSELRQMLIEAKAVRQAGLANEAADREHRGDDVPDEPDHDEGDAS
jgi:hypothetical protein